MLISRNNYLEKIDSSIQQVSITVLIGARQVGKTSILKSYKPNTTIVHLDGQHPDTQNLFSDINSITEYLKINLNETLSGLLIIDEFQMINRISSTLKILADNFAGLKILCSGSSSLDIIQKVEESLAGRVRMINAYSLSFAENILFKSKALYAEFEKYDGDTGTAVISSQVKQVLNDQLLYGGMPRVCLTNKPEERIQILDDIFKTYLLRDVKSYVRNADSVGFNKLLSNLAIQTGNLVNINELSRTTGLTYNKCEEYIYLLEQMYIIKMISPYEANAKKAIKKMKKVYFLDLGIRNVIIQNFNPLDIRSDSGSLFENFVFLEILKSIKSYYTVNFFRTRDGAEVDFIINDMRKKISVEAKYKQLEKPIYLKALNNFNEREGISHSYVINLQLNAKVGDIRYVPAYLINKVFLGN